MSRLPLPVKILIGLLVWPYALFAGLVYGVFFLVRSRYYQQRVIPGVKNGILEEAFIPSWETYQAFRARREETIPQGDPEFFLLFLLKRYLAQVSEVPAFTGVDDYLRWQKTNRAALLKANEDLLQRLYGKLWVRFSMGEKSPFTALVIHHLQTNPLAVERFWPAQNLVRKTPWLKDQITQWKVFDNDPAAYTKDERAFRAFLDVFFFKLVTSHASLRDPAFTAPNIEGLLKDLPALPQPVSRTLLPAESVGEFRRQEEQEQARQAEANARLVERRREQNTRALREGHLPFQWIMAQGGRLPDNVLEAFREEARQRGLDPFEEAEVQEMLEEACRQYPAYEQRCRTETFRYFRGESPYQADVVRFCADREVDESTNTVMGFFLENLWILEPVKR